MRETFTIPSGDYALSAELFLPKAEPDIAYVLHGATGVPQAYYEKFADWVATQGHACLTYSYRSDGADVAALRRSKILMSDWGVHDQNAALNALIARFPTAEIRVIGHSLGGFMTMFHEQADRVASLSAVCSGPAYWRRTPIRKIGLAMSFWYILGPLSVRTRGYLDGKVLGSSGSLPSSAFAQWKRWCGNRNLHQPEWGSILPQPDLDRFRGRLNLVGVKDDYMIAPYIVRDLRRFYPKATPEFRCIAPKDIDADSIGHLSIFRPKAQAVWPKLL